MISGVISPPSAPVAIHQDNSEKTIPQAKRTRPVPEDQSSKQNDITRSLANFVSETNIAALSKEIREKLSQLLLDYIGMAVSGAQIPESAEPFQKAVAVMVGSTTGTATVFGTSLRYPPHFAALLNGAHAHSLDFDDTQMKGVLHPGVTVISAALAEAEGGSSSTDEVLAALAVGYEIACRLGEAVGLSGYERGFHNTATCGIFGAVASISNLRKLDASVVENAFGLALSMAAGSMQYLENGSWNKRLHPGLAAQHAFQAVAFAEAGVLGAALPFERTYGFFHSYAADPDTSKLTEALGMDWHFLSTALKPYPACRMTHGQIEIAGKLGQVDKGAIVEKIVVKMHSKCIPIVGKPTPNKIHPENVVDAQFSVYYQTAVSFLYGSNLGWSVYDYLQDDRVRSLCDRITVETEDGTNATATALKVHLESGSVLEDSVEHLLWEDERPVTWDALEAKFDGLVSNLLGPEKTKAIIGWSKDVSSKGIEELVKIART